MTDATKNLSAAVAAVMAGVHRLKKDDTNKHGGYKYVSVDDIKDSLRPLLAENGLEVSITETAYSIVQMEGRNGPTISAQFTFEIYLRHINGESTAPERTTVLLPHTGAQTTGAAKSYALKEWLKTRFLVSTGEKDLVEGGADADAYTPQNYTKQAPSAPQLLTRDEARSLYKQLEKELVTLGSQREVTEWKELRNLEIKKLGDWRSYIDAAIESHEKFLNSKVQVAAE